VVKIKRKSPEHPPQFQGVLRLAEGSKRLILSTRSSESFDLDAGWPMEKAANDLIPGLRCLLRRRTRLFDFLRVLLVVERLFHQVEVSRVR
jgi:hypothetical protein